eukprot:358157-Chlamydomonas_euryale.AAC.5
MVWYAVGTRVRDELCIGAYLPPVHTAAAWDISMSRACKNSGVRCGARRARGIESECLHDGRYERSAFITSGVDRHS